MDGTIRHVVKQKPAFTPFCTAKMFTGVKVRGQEARSLHPKDGNKPFPHPLFHASISIKAEMQGAVGAIPALFADWRAGAPQFLLL